jgi:L-lactate dehydrogenase complex protein LldE
VVRIALFITCVNDTLFPEAGRATVQVLERLGHTVVFPEEQTCCGQMHANSGYEHEALALVRRFARVFGVDASDAVVAPSGSCVAMVRHQYPRLAEQAGDDKLVEAVSTLASRVFELSEFLVEQLGVEDVGAYYPHCVTYHPSCHALRVLRIGDAPLRLLRNVRGLELVELPEAESCCGFGGTFAIKNADTSAAMLTDKLRAILETGAEVCTAVDCSCLLHLGGGLSRQRAGVRTAHLAEILASEPDGDER